MTTRKFIKRLVLEEFVRVIKERDFDPQHFRTSAGKEDEFFLTKGRRDDELEDDVIPSKQVTIPAVQLKPSQREIFLGKSLGMAILGIAGGNLDAIISQDNFILDGHHRWAATMLNKPDANITGLQVDMPIKELIPVLRSVGDSYGNQRRGEPEGGDVNIFKANPGVLKNMIEQGQYMSSRFYNPKKAMAWLESHGGYKVLAQRLATIQEMSPPSKAPPRTKMPVIDPKKGQLRNVANRLKKGTIDTYEPYAQKE